MARKMQIEEFLRYVAIPLFGFGVVGAAGPRFMGFALGRASAEKTNLYWFTATPFEQYAQTIHQYNFNADTVTADDLYAVHAIEKDILAFLEGLKPLNMNFATPTFIITNFDPKIGDNFHKSITLMSEIVNHSTGGRQTLRNLQKFPMRSMDRLTHEVIGQESETEGAIAQTNEISFKDVLELTMTIVDPDHVKAEIKALMVSWSGLIKHHVEAKNFAQINGAMSWRQFLPLLSLFPKLAKMIQQSAG